MDLNYFLVEKGRSLRTFFCLLSFSFLVSHGGCPILAFPFSHILSPRYVILLGYHYTVFQSFEHSFYLRPLPHSLKYSDMELSPRHETDIQHKPLEPISVLAPFSALIISIALVVFSLIRLYVLENFLIKWAYGSIYTDLNEINRRGFVNHHIAGVSKILILIVAVYPFVNVTFCEATFHTPFTHGSPVTMGDLMVVVAQVLIAMYIFELIYRAKLSPVAVLHHIGTILIGQSAIAISLRLAREPDADIEFILCTVWGKLTHYHTHRPNAKLCLQH